MQDEPNWHRADTDKYESEGEGELYEFGQESLDRLALALGGNTVAPLASGLLPTLLQDPDWKKRHAALICISQIAEGCVKVLVKNVHGLADMCIQVRLTLSPQTLCPRDTAARLRAGSRYSMCVRQFSLGSQLAMHRL